MSNRCFYFGCWNEAGHFLHEPGGRHPRSPNYFHQAEMYGGKEQIHLDGSLAPRKHKWDPSPVWRGMGVIQKERDRVDRDSEEYKEGQFLLHVLDNGFTAIQWWDRHQGDKRGACNSTILLEGTHNTAEMIEALKVNFPHVLEKLTRAGIVLVEISKP